MRIMEISFLFEQYIAYITHMRWYTPATINGYRDTFKAIQKDIPMRSVHEISQFTIENWLMDGRIRKKWMPNTFICHHKRLNCFFEWLKKKGVIEKNFVKEIEKPRLEQRLPRRLSKDNAEILIQATRSFRYTYKFEKCKNVAIIAIMLLWGLRKSEVLNLKTHDIDMDKCIIHVIQWKWKKDRIVPMCSRLHTILWEYFSERKRLEKTTEFLITPSQNDRWSGVKSVDRLILRLKKKTGLDFSAHTLRHSFATLMLEGGCDIYALSKMMGHSKITTTTIYLACSEKSLLQSIEKHPLN